jgi:hypothetical protein
MHKEYENEMVAGYYCGADLNKTMPANSNPFFIHGFRTGRDDAEIFTGLKKFPDRTAEQTRNDFLYIYSMSFDE